MKSEKSSKRRRIEELRALENGVQSGEDVIYDGGEIVTSPAVPFTLPRSKTAENWNTSTRSNL